MPALKKKPTISSKLLLSENLRSGILAFSFPIALILGTYGYYNYSFGEVPTSLTNAFYHAAQLFIMHTPHFATPVPWSLEIARWMAAASTVLALFNTALYILHFERMRFALRFMKNHTIVCGLGRRGINIAEKLHKSGNLVVAIDKNPEQEVVQRLHALGIPLIIGDATRKQILKKARIEYAESLFTFCLEDTTNFSIALAAHNEESITKPPRKCYIHINDAELRNALQANYPKVSGNKEQTHLFIDSYGPEAISLLAHGLPLDHDGISPNDIRKVHLIILGFGCMGRTIAVKAAQLGQFANRKKMQISVIDRNAEINKATLLFHHPFIQDVADFSFYRQEILSPETRFQIEKWCDVTETIVNIVVCFDNTPITYDAIFNLLPVLNRKNVRVVLRVSEPESFEFLLKGKSADKYSDLNIKSFGIDKGLEALIHPQDDEAEKFAVDIHNAYVDLINEKNASRPDEFGDTEKKEIPEELKPWGELPEDFRESNRQQAVHMYFKLRACGFEIADKEDERPAIETFEKKSFDALAVMEHDRWVAERKVNNWRFGNPSVKANRINKNITDWDKLEPHIQQYDYDSVALIPKLLKKVGKKMVAKKKT